MLMLLATRHDHALRPGPLGVLLALILIEAGAGWLWLQRARLYDVPETAASFGIAVVQHLLRVMEAGLLAVPFTVVYQHRLLHFESASAAAWTVLFMASEFIYYWEHRASHRIRWMWATHAVHHSTTRFNLSAAIRLGWTGLLSGNFVFLLPLVWIGFHPLAVTGMLGINLLYQLLIHTTVVPRLGVLEWVFNTPSHHRVHHACNDACLDRNFGGILIVFDRLFGTFAAAPAHEALRYGLAGHPPSNNVLIIALGEWWRMLSDLKRAVGWRRRIAVLAGPPETIESPVTTVKKA